MATRSQLAGGFFTFSFNDQTGQVLTVDCDNPTQYRVWQEVTVYTDATLTTLATLPAPYPNPLAFTNEPFQRNKSVNVRTLNLIGQVKVDKYGTTYLVPPFTVRTEYPYAGDPIALP